MPCLPYLPITSNIDILHFLQEYQSFRIGSDGNLQGVGLFVCVEPNTGHLVSKNDRMNLLFYFFFSQI